MNHQLTLGFEVWTRKLMQRYDFFLHFPRNLTGKTTCAFVECQSVKVYIIPYFIQGTVPQYVFGNAFLTLSVLQLVAVHKVASITKTWDYVLMLVECRVDSSTYEDNIVGWEEFL